MHKLHITLAANDNLTEISAYITLELHNLQATRRIVKSIAHDLRQLQQNPYMGFSVSAKTDREIDLRALLGENYFLFYHVENALIQVPRVLDGRQDYLRELFRNVEKK